MKVEVKKTVDAYVVYQATVEVDDEDIDALLEAEPDLTREEAAGTIAARYAQDGEVKDWGEGDPEEFDATGYEALDGDGWPMEITRTGKLFG